MQVSALSTIIAAQQARSATPTARPAAGTQAAKTAAAPLPGQEFAPLAFAAPAAATTATEDAPARPAYLANAPMGSQVDIRI